jgi:hypothetical protein
MPQYNKAGGDAAKKEFQKRSDVDAQKSAGAGGTGQTRPPPAHQRRPVDECTKDDEGADDMHCGSEEKAAATSSVLEELKKVHAKMDATTGLATRTDKLALRLNRLEEAIAKEHDSVTSLRADVTGLHLVNGGSFSGVIEGVEGKQAVLEGTIASLSREAIESASETRGLINALRDEVNQAMERDTLVGEGEGDARSSRGGKGDDCTTLRELETVVAGLRGSAEEAARTLEKHHIGMRREDEALAGKICEFEKNLGGRIDQTKRAISVQGAAQETAASRISALEERLSTFRADMDSRLADTAEDKTKMHALEMLCQEAFDRSVHTRVRAKRPLACCDEGFTPGPPVDAGAVLELRYPMVPRKGDVYMREVEVGEDGTVSIRLVAVETDGVLNVDFAWGAETNSETKRWASGVPS